MAQTFSVEVEAEASELYAYLCHKMSHVQKVSEDVFSDTEQYVAVLIYEQYFWRVGNQIALTVIINRLESGRCCLKTISCGSSKGMVFKLDLGAASAFAREPINYAEERYNVIWQR
ncbi:MAG TPA: DUF6054 family protein [Oscillospiraceae bacterium]|nr:DUF6054 family protein [Oscillospiraceae bacterium]